MLRNTFLGIQNVVEFLFNNTLMMLFWVGLIMLFFTGIYLGLLHSVLGFIISLFAVFLISITIYAVVKNNDIMLFTFCMILVFVGVFYLCAALITNFALGLVAALLALIAELLLEHILDQIEEEDEELKQKYQ